MPAIKTLPNLPQFTLPKINPTPRAPVPPSGAPETQAPKIESKTFAATIAFQLGIVALPGLGAAQNPFNHPGLIAVIDELWIMVSPTVLAQLVDPTLCGMRWRQEQGGKIIIPTLGDLPQRWPDTDVINSWTHPTAEYRQVLPSTGIEFRHGDPVFQEVYNIHAAAVTMSISYKGHYKRVEV